MPFLGLQPSFTAGEVSPELIVRTDLAKYQIACKLLQNMKVHPQGGASYPVQLPDAAYSLYVQDSLEFHSPVIRLRYEALNRPAQVRQLELATGAQQVLKQTPVEGPFDADAYESRRLWATAADGTQVPISLVARREVLAAGAPAPLYLYGYGAYGESLDPWFSHARLSLLERGLTFAIAHVRGGGELGEAWYRAGKLEPLLAGDRA